MSLPVTRSHVTSTKKNKGVCKGISDREDFFEVGRSGIEHVFLTENGFVKPGQLVIGGDSHTGTYAALGALGLGMGNTDLA